MLKSIAIGHFKSIESAALNFNNVTILVGNNGSGKTNIVDAIRFIKDASSNGLDRAFSDRHGVESVRQWSPTRPFQINFSLVFAEEYFWATYSIGIDSAKGDFRVTKEELDVRLLDDEYEDVAGEITSTKSLKRTLYRRDKINVMRKQTWSLAVDDSFVPGNLLSELTTWYGSATSVEDTKIDSQDELLFSQRAVWELYTARERITNFQAYSIFPNTLRSPQEPSNETFLAPEGRNLASVLKRMRKTKSGAESIAQITEAMRSILPNLDRISILSVGGYLVPQFHMLEPTGKKHIFNVAQMSDGSLRVLGLLTALYQNPRPRIVALEEPEQTVNPGILAVIADSIKEISKTTQVIVTTHSPHLLDQFLPEQIRAVELEQGKTHVGEVRSMQIEVVRERLFTLGELLVSEGLQIG